MKDNQKEKLFKEIFAPKNNEKILFLLNKQNDSAKNIFYSKETQEIALEWFNTFKELGKSFFSVDKIEFKSTPYNNSPAPIKVIDEVKKSNLTIAITDYSITSSIAPICLEKNSITRGASIFRIDNEMERIILNTNYKEIKDYSIKIEKILNNSIGAKISFSTDDDMYIDLRNRIAGSDRGECINAGQFINLPSGEGFKCPYEGTKNEIKSYGPSKTEGILPLIYENDLIKLKVNKNRIIDIIGSGENAKKIGLFFNENKNRRNIAELGIGCNPMAKITGKTIVDEKVGLHIAYGMSKHLGGKVYSNVHQDIVYSKGCPIEAKNLILINEDGEKIELIKKSKIQYNLLKKELV